MSKRNIEMLNQEDIKKEVYDLMALNFSSIYDNSFNGNVVQKLHEMEREAASKDIWKEKSKEEIANMIARKEYDNLTEILSIDVRKFIIAQARKMIEEQESEKIEDGVWKGVEAEIQKVTTKEFSEGRLWGKTEGEMHARKSLEVDAIMDKYSNPRLR
jgi:hypothetical protein